MPLGTPPALKFWLGTRLGFMSPLDQSAAPERLVRGPPPFAQRSRGGGCGPASLGKLMRDQRSGGEPAQPPGSGPGGGGDLRRGRSGGPRPLVGFGRRHQRVLLSQQRREALALPSQFLQASNEVIRIYKRRPAEVDARGTKLLARDGTKGKLPVGVSIVADIRILVPNSGIAFDTPGQALLGAKRSSGQSYCLRPYRHRPQIDNGSLGRLRRVRSSIGWSRPLHLRWWEMRGRGYNWGW